jgi:predicted nucleic acid-binding Zn ribbon protein
MPRYEFHCDSCKGKTELKMSFAEHDRFKKEGMDCPCGGKFIQTVAPLHFKLKGWGWYASESTQGVDPYGISDREIEANLDFERRAEDNLYEMNAKNIGGDE